MNEISPMSDDPITSNVEMDVLPAVEYRDIYNLISTPSPYTKEYLKAYKSLDGYKYFLAGWVGDVSSFQVSGSQHFIVRAEVRQCSNRQVVSWGWSSSSPLQGWSSLTTLLVPGSSKHTSAPVFLEASVCVWQTLFPFSSHPQPFASSSLGDWKRDWKC